MCEGFYGIDIIWSNMSYHIINYFKYKWSLHVLESDIEAFSMLIFLSRLLLNQFCSCSNQSKI